jgi:hypothetical protein
MSIWTYKDDAVGPAADYRWEHRWAREHRWANKCVFCASPLNVIETYSNNGLESEFFEKLHAYTWRAGGLSSVGRMHCELVEGDVTVCPSCGWWRIWCIEGFGGDIFGSCGALACLDTNDITTPIGTSVTT